MDLIQPEFRWSLSLVLTRHCHRCLLLRPQEVVPRHLNYQGHMGEKELLGFNVGDYDSVGMRWELGLSALKKMLS